MVGIVGWALLLGAGLAWEGVALVRRDDTWPTVSDILRAVTTTVPGRWIVFALWLWWGWHLFVRGWGFFLRVPPGEGEDSARRHLLAAAPMTADEAMTEIVLPLCVAYALVLGGLWYWNRRAGGRAREPLRPRSLVTHVLVTACCGYALFLLGALAYYGLAAGASLDFLTDAAGGGAFLAFAVALPVFLLAARPQRDRAAPEPR
jgi:hypothetical protein